VVTANQLLQRLSTNFYLLLDTFIKKGSYIGISELVIFYSAKKESLISKLLTLMLQGLKLLRQLQIREVVSLVHTTVHLKYSRMRALRSLIYGV